MSSLPGCYAPSFSRTDVLSDRTSFTHADIAGDLDLDFEDLGLTIV